MPKEQDLFDSTLLRDKSIKKLIKHKRDGYTYAKIKKNRLSEFQEEKWEVKEEHKTSYRMKKQKPHDIAFEDRVWALFARMGFTIMNKDRLFKIPYSKDSAIPGKQIDVFAADGETVVIVECKSSEVHKRGNFQKDIAEIASLKGNIYANIKKYLDYNPKFAWIFATNNVFLNQPDEARAKEAGILHLSQDDISYYEDLINHLGSTARYQLFGALFKGQTIPELDCKVPAVKGTAGGYTVYSFSLEPETLLKISFVLHRTDSTKKAFESYQRMIKKPRIKQIEAYINDGGFFPNAIIININSKKPLQFDLASSASHPSVSQLGVLHLPNQYHSAFLIDGQHRLYGYANTEWKSKNTIPVVAFVNLPEEVQTKIFVDINNKQKSVSQNLLMTLMGEFNWGSENDDEAIAAVKTRLVDLLNNENESPLYKRIRISDEKGSVRRCLTKNYLIGQALSKTHFFGVIQKRKIVTPGFFLEKDYEATLNKTYKVLELCLSFMEGETKDQWEKGGSEGGFIAMNLGISASIRVIDDILRFLEQDEKLDPRTMTAEDIAHKVIPYIKPVAEFVKGLNYEQIKKLRGHVGGGAVDVILREFQDKINNEFPKFIPEGLEKWQKEQTGAFNAPSKALGDEMQMRVNECIFRRLKKEYGTQDKRWWNEGVHKEVQKDCARKRIEEGAGQDEDYINLLDYQRIIKEQKTFFLESFTPPDMGSSSIEKKLSWFTKWNSIRNKYSHPERGKVTEEEYKFLGNLSKWLIPKLS